MVDMPEEIKRRFLTHLTGAVQCKMETREEIDQLTKEYLARGGKVQVLTQEPPMQPWVGTEKQALANLISIGQLARISNRQSEDLKLRARAPGAPVAYQFRGEIHFLKSEAISWARGNNRSGV